MVSRVYSRRALSRFAAVSGYQRIQPDHTYRGNAWVSSLFLVEDFDTENLLFRMPQQYMMDMGKQTSHFFDSHVDVYGHKKYRLKSIEQYSRERNANEQPGKQYFKATTLPDIINQAPMPNFKSTRHGTEMEKGDFCVPISTIVC